MRVLVTGADGFGGARLVARLRAAGHEPLAAVRPAGGTGRALPPEVETVPLELTDPGSVRRATARPLDAVAHLAAVASGADARRDPEAAWVVNALGTARLAEAVAEGAPGDPPLFLLASTAEVYGAGTGEDRPRRESDAPAPCSPYAASKLAAEVAAFEVHRRLGLRTVVARAFPHTGGGQDDRFVVPAFARRLLAARRSGAAAVEVGNLDPVRDFLHVDDVVDAYCRLLDAGRPGEVYNVASGDGVSIGDLFDRLARIVKVRVIPEVDAQLVRAADIPHLVGDAGKLRRETGWAPATPLDETLTEVVRAQAD